MGRRACPTTRNSRFWEIYEQVRTETEIVDLPEVASRYAFEAGSQALHRELSHFLWDYPFVDIAFPGSHEAVRHFRTLGEAVILCDGHEVFQRHKLHRSGFASDVARDRNHNILVCVHKEHHAADIRALFPARHYVMVDDKPRIHRAMKASFGDSITTVLVRQGHYASGSAHDAAVDIELSSIAEAARLTAEHFKEGSGAR